VEKDGRRFDGDRTGTLKEGWRRREGGRRATRKGGDMEESQNTHSR
jgi:hypothetical protein